MEKWNLWISNLKEKEQLVSGSLPLHIGGKRVNGGAIVTDISTPELKELVSGYSIRMTKDMDEAVEIAKKCPIFSFPDTLCEVRGARCEK